MWPPVACRAEYYVCQLQARGSSVTEEEAGAEGPSILPR